MQRSTEWKARGGRSGRPFIVYSTTYDVRVLLCTDCGRRNVKDFLIISEYIQFSLAKQKTHAHSLGADVAKMGSHHRNFPQHWTLKLLLEIHSNRPSSKTYLPMSAFFVHRYAELLSADSVNTNFFLSFVFVFVFIFIRFIYKFHSSELIGGKCTRRWLNYNEK